MTPQLPGEPLGSTPNHLRHSLRLNAHATHCDTCCVLLRCDLPQTSINDLSREGTIPPDRCANKHGLGRLNLPPACTARFNPAIYFDRSTGRFDSRGARTGIAVRTSSRLAVAPVCDCNGNCLRLTGSVGMLGLVGSVVGFMTNLWLVCGIPADSLRSSPRGLCTGEHSHRRGGRRPDMFGTANQGASRPSTLSLARSRHTDTRTETSVFAR